MDLIVALYWLLALLLCVMMFAQGMSRKVDLFSIRNIYLCGFIVSQIISPALALQADNYHLFHIVDPMKAGRWLLLFNYVFVAIFLLSYHRFKFADRLAGKFPKGSGQASDSLLTTLAVVTIVAAAAIRLVGMRIPAITAISIATSLALASVGCAIMGWVWAARRVNPAVLSVSGIVLITGMMISLSGHYSRRPLISVLAGFAWGVYHRWVKKLSPSMMMVGTVPLVLVVGLIVAAFTAIRSHETSTTEAGATVQQMKNANISKGTSDLLGGQAVGPAALWILDSFPHKHEYRPLFGLKYMVYWWVPRFMWQDKPEPLSTEIATLARLRGVNRKGITLPPGVIGYAGAEGGFYAVVVYAIFFGQFTRFFDSLVRLNPTNPFIILPVGCSTGQFLGLARGDISTFATLAVVGFASSYLLIYLTSVLFGNPSSQSQIRAPLPHPR